MAAGYVTKTVGDGNGGTFSARFWSSDGTGTGLLYPAPVTTDSAGAVVPAATSTLQTTGNSLLGDLVTAAQATTPVNVFPFPTTPVSGMTAQMTGTTSTLVTGMGTPAASKFNWITNVTISNTDIAVGTLIELQDGNGGTSFYSFPAPKATAAGDVNGSTFTFPTPLKQPTAATALYAKNVTTSAETIVSVSGFQALAPT